MPKNILPVFISSKTSMLNVLKVVSPPKIPTVKKVFNTSENIFGLFVVTPNIQPMKKHPAIFTNKVPKIDVAKNLFDNIVTKNLKVAPIPPPTNTENNFKTIIFLLNKLLTYFYVIKVT